MDLNLSKEERKLRIVARGELSDHAHVVVGDATVTEEEDGTITVEVGEKGAKMRHLLESTWLHTGRQVSIYDKEEGRDGHKDIDIAPGKYKYVPQIENDPFEKTIRRVQD